MSPMNVKEFVQYRKGVLKDEAASFAKPPKLCIIQANDNPASDAYIRGKLKDSDELGYLSELWKFEPTITQEELLTKMQEAGKKTGWQFIIYTTDQGVSSEKIESCADNFYKNGSFQKNAILLVIDSKSNTRIIRNKGEVKDYFAHDDSRMESIISEMKPYLNSGDMYGASKAFVSKSVDIYSMGKTNILLISLKKIGPFAGIAGVIIAVVFFFITKSRYKNMGKSGTYDLASNSKVDLDEVEDTFVTQHTTVRTIKSDNDSGSGSSNHSDGSGSRAF